MLNRQHQHFYTVKAGESLDSIAQKFGFRNWRDIYEDPANADLRKQRKNANEVKPGDVLVIPTRTEKNTTPVEFKLTVIDSVSGAFVPDITLRLRVPDGDTLTREITWATNAQGQIIIKNPWLTRGKVDVLEVRDEIPAPWINYPGVTKFGLATGTDQRILIKDKRRVADAVVTAHGIQRRAAWGTRTPNYAKMDQDWDYSIVVIHHSGNGGETDPKQIEKKHMVDRKWDDVGYHYLITPNGTIYEGRHLAFKGSHVELANTGKIGILIMGDFESQWWDDDDDPSKEQLDSAVSLITTLKSHFALTALGGHKDYKADTECPGNELYGKLGDLRKRTGLGGP